MLTATARSNRLGISVALTALLAVSCSRSAPPAAKLQVDDFIAEVDTNHDGLMSHEEWKAKGLPESAFKMLDKDHDDRISAQEMKSETPPPGIDANGDGKLTVAEFLAFDKAHRH